MNSIKTGAAVERDWVAALSDEQVDEPAHSTSSEEEFENDGMDAYVMMTDDRSEIKGLMVVEANCNHAERAQVQTKTQIE